jgi:YidC/Oxa1 family membrane protein insertase
VINQTRTLLVVALFFVAYLLWQAWQHDYPSVPPPAPPAPAQVAPGVPEASAIPATAGSVAVPPPEAAAPAGNTGASPTPKQDLVTASNDLLKLTIDPRGGTIVGAALLNYPEKV